MGRETSLGAVADASGALLAGGSPALADGGAAVELGAHDALDLVDAGVVDASEEAGSLAIICGCASMSHVVSVCYRVSLPRRHVIYLPRSQRIPVNPYTQAQRPGVMQRPPFKQPGPQMAVTQEARNDNRPMFTYTTSARVSAAYVVRSGVRCIHRYIDTGC